MHARLSFYDTGGASKDEIANAFEQAGSAVEQMQGNQGGMLLVSPEGQKAITITLWGSEDDLRATEGQADQIRQQAAEGASMTIRSVESYEVALEFGAGQ